MKLKSLTDTSWMLLDDKSERVGVLTKSTSSFILTTPGGKTTFADEKEINSFFMEDIFTKVEANVKVEENFMLDAWPVSSGNPIKIKSENSLPCYVKKEGSKAVHCAGYYCLKFPGGWITSFCPRLSTVEKYEYAGPFKTEIEARSHTSLFKK